MTRFRFGRQASFLLAHTMLSQAIIFVLRPAVSYRALEQGVPPSWLGVLSAGFALVPLILAIPAGRLVDRVGERTILLLGGGTTCAASGCFLLFGTSVAGLLTGSVVLGTAHLCAAVGQQALVANTAGAGRYDAAFGHYTFAASLGQALGPLLIVLFGGSAAIPDTTPIFLGATVLAAALLGCAWFVRSGPTAGRRQGTEAAPPGIRSLLRIPGIFRALLVSSVVLAAVDIILVYLPALGAERGLAAGVIGVLLGLRAVAAMTSRLLLSRLVGVLGRRSLLVVSVLASAACLGIAAAPVPAWLLFCAVIVAGFGLGVGQPLTMSWLAESTAPGLRGRAMSLRLTANRGGQVLIPSAAGFTAVALGATGVLGITAAGLALLGYQARKLGLDGPARETTR